MDTLATRTPFALTLHTFTDNSFSTIEGMYEFEKDPLPRMPTFGRLDTSTYFDVSTLDVLRASPKSAHENKISPINFLCGGIKLFFFHWNLCHLLSYHECTQDKTHL